MLGDLNNDNFNREWERHYLRSVHAATAAAFESSAGDAPERVYVTLALELRERGIEVDRDAVYSAAMLISRGQQPAILKQGSGRHRRNDLTLM
jgi:hypothetical protein